MSSPARSQAPRIRPATPADSAECGRICYEAFSLINQTHGFPPEIPSVEAAIGLCGMLFSHPGFFCVVAEIDGRVVGSNCLDERSTIGGVGPVTVDPAVQNLGIGRALMQAVVNRSLAHGAPGVRLLQSAFHNRSLSLYTKLGFNIREPVSVMQGAPISKAIEGRSVREAKSSDHETCDKLCERVHGHTRSGELRDGINQGTALVAESGGRITGYASGFGYFAHAVGESNVDLQALLAVAPAYHGPGVLVPSRNSELFRWCLENGLRVVQPMTLMTMGLYNEPSGSYLPSILY